MNATSENFIEYRALRTFAESGHFNSFHRETVGWVATAARHASLHFPGFYQLSDLERLLGEVADRALPPHSADVPPGASPRSRVLHLVSGGTGLDRRLAGSAAWSSADRNAHTVVAIETAPSPGEDAAPAAPRAGEDAAPPSPSSEDLRDVEVLRLGGHPLENASQLRAAAADAAAVVLFVSTYDPVSVLALAGLASPPVILVDPAPRRPWLGVSAANLLLVPDLPARDLAIGERGIPAEHVMVLDVAQLSPESVEEVYAGASALGRIPLGPDPSAPTSAPPSDGGQFSAPPSDGGQFSAPPPDSGQSSAGPAEAEADTTEEIPLPRLIWETFSATFGA